MSLSQEEKNSLTGKDNGINSTVVDSEVVQNPAASRVFSKIFGIMFLALLLTAGVTFLFGWMDASIVGLKFTESGMPYIPAQSSNAYIGLWIGGIVALIGLIVFSIMAGAFMAKDSTKPTYASQHSVLFPFIGFGICMSYYLGLLVFVVPWQAIVVAFLITVIVFGVMALIGMLIKEKGGIILMIVLSALCGVGLIFALSSLFLIWFPGGYYWFCVATSGIMLAIIMIVTIIDVCNIKSITARGGTYPNMVLYLAFSLYVDFIVLFVRILLIVAAAMARR